MFPTLFHVGDFGVPAYGTMLGLGFLAGIALGQLRGQRDGLPGDWAWDLGILAILGGVIGGRLEHVRTLPEVYAGKPWTQVLALRDGGMVFYGGLVGALVLFWLYSRWRRVSFFALTDIMAPSVAFGHAFGRVGCLGAGCCYGAPTDGWWAITFPEGARAPAGVPRIPTQVHEIVFNLGLAVLLWVVPRRFLGHRFALLLALYGVFRAVNEQFRVDSRGSFAGTALTPGVGTSLVMVAAAVAIWVAQRNVQPPERVG